jgi:hypothetical protein
MVILKGNLSFFDFLSKRDCTNKPPIFPKPIIALKLHYVSIIPVCQHAQNVRILYAIMLVHYSVSIL